MDEPLTYIEAIVDYEGKPYLQMAVPFDYLESPCTKCAFNRLNLDCTVEIEDVLRTSRNSKWPCIDNIRSKEYVFIEPLDHEEFIAHIVAKRLEGK